MKCQSSLANSRAVLWEAAAESAKSLNERTVTGMADLIDRDALLADIAASVVFSGKNSRNAEIRGANKIIDRVKAAPTIEADHVKHGRWIEGEDEYGLLLTCSVYGEEFVSWEADCARTNYCQNCGADMRGERK